MSDLISVIVPVYNVEKLIIKCVNSIINQTYTNLEIILVNDGSTDNSLQVCKSIALKDERVKVFDKSNGGASSARNFGIKKANGKYIQFVDSDDYLNKDYTESLYLPFIKNNDLDLSTAGYTIVQDNNLFENMPSKNELLTADMINSNLFYKLVKAQYGFIDSPINKLYKTSKIQMFDCSMRLSEDAVFNLSYLQNIHNIYTVKNAGYFYTMNEGSLTHSFKKNAYIDLQKANSILVEYINQKSVPVDNDELYDIITGTLFRCIQSYIVNKESNKSIKELIINMLKNKELHNVLNMKRNRFKQKLMTYLLIKRKKYTLFIWLYKMFCRVKRIKMKGKI